MRILSFLLLAVAALFAPIIAFFRVAFSVDRHGGHRPLNPTPRSILETRRMGLA